MATTNVLGTVYETLLCSPGMSETVKIDVKVNRKTILLLSNIIGSRLQDESGDNSDLFAWVSKDTIDELRQFSEDCLQKAGLKELSEKIKGLNSTK